MAGTFLLWKGANLREQQIMYYASNLYMNQGKSPSFVQLPGIVLCSLNLSDSICVAARGCLPDHKPVLFMISCHNYYSPKGIRLSSEAFTAYPAECEIMLRENSGVYVLGIERDALITIQ